MSGYGDTGKKSCGSTSLVQSFCDRPAAVEKKIYGRPAGDTGRE